VFGSVLPLSKVFLMLRVNSVAPPYVHLTTTSGFLMRAQLTSGIVLACHNSFFRLHNFAAFSMHRISSRPFGELERHSYTEAFQNDKSNDIGSLATLRSRFYRVTHCMKAHYTPPLFCLSARL